MNAQECLKVQEALSTIHSEDTVDGKSIPEACGYAKSCVQAIGQSGEELPEYLPTNYEEDDINAGYNNCLVEITPLYAKRLLEIEELKQHIETLSMIGKENYAMLWFRQKTKIASLEKENAELRADTETCKAQLKSLHEHHKAVDKDRIKFEKENNFLKAEVERLTAPTGKE